MRWHFQCVGAAVLAALSDAPAAAQPCLEQRITPESTFSFGYFSETVAIDGDQVIVGQPTLAHIGSAFLFDFNQQTGWTQVQHAVAPDGAPGDTWCSDGVAIDGEWAAITSRPHQHQGYPGAGAVWMLRRLGSEWNFEQEILPPEEVGGFSGRVQIDDSRLVVTKVGFVFVYDFDGRAWNLRQTIPQPYPGLIAYGWSVSIDSDVLVVGAPDDGSMCDDPKLGEFGVSGLVFVYRFNGTEWVQEQLLAPSDFGCGRHFGTSVAVSEETIIATAQNPVATYVFEYDQESSQWIETAIFPGVGPESGARPHAAAIEGDWAVIGDDSDDEAHVFHRQPDGSWVLVDLLQPPQALWFGQAVAIDQGRAIIGAFGEDGGHGAAYIYRLNAPSADLNCDGAVNGLDLGNLLANWSIPPDMPGCQGDTPCASDINADGLVNGLDLGILLANWSL